MTSILQLSDLHIRGSNVKEENRNCQVIVSQIGERYSAYEEKPVILITGDIVDDGKKNQYKNAVTILKPLIDAGFVIYACPGNHDYGPYGNFYTEKSQGYFLEYILGDLLSLEQANKAGTTMEDIYPIVNQHEDTVFVGLDSVVGKEDELLHFASGEVGKEQRAKLFTILEEHVPSEKSLIVYLHHHPFYRAIGLDMDDAKEVLRMLAGKVDILCFGHRHKSEVWTATNAMDWVLASGKTTERNDNYRFQYRHVAIDSRGNNEVSMVTFTG